MDVSIILASYNGATTLPRTLAALAAVDRPAGECEIILVDNNSNDETPQLMEAFEEEFGAIALSEPRQGKAFALNTGLDHAQGRLVVFTDDDTLPHPDWITAYIEAAGRYPNSSVFSGQIRPEWPYQPPAWLAGLAQRGRSFACTPEDLPEGPSEPHHAKGPNLMVRGDVARALRFGVDAQNYGGGKRARGNEDTDYVLRARAMAGGDIVHVPAARVRHIIRPSEMSLGAVFERYQRIGIGQPQIQPYTRLGVAATLVRSLVLLLLYGVTLQRDRLADQFVTLAMQIGRLKALMRP
ncbi:MAG: glycosyltransferase [Pseudomonadota bacterium]